MDDSKRLGIPASVPWKSNESVSATCSSLRGSLALFHISAEVRIVKQQEKDLCLDFCPFPECINCLEGGKQTKSGRPKKIKMEVSEE